MSFLTEIIIPFKKLNIIKVGRGIFCLAGDIDTEASQRAVVRRSQHTACVSLAVFKLFKLGDGKTCHGICGGADTQRKKHIGKAEVFLFGA